MTTWPKEEAIESVVSAYRAGKCTLSYLVFRFEQAATALESRMNSFEYSRLIDCVHDLEVINALALDEGRKFSESEAVSVRKSLSFIESRLREL